MSRVCHKYSAYKSSCCASAVLLKGPVPLGLILDGFLQFWTSGLGDSRELWIMADALGLHGISPQHTSATEAKWICFSG